MVVVGGVEGGGSAEGQKKQKNKLRLYMGQGWRMIYAKVADIPPPFSSTCFLKRSEKLETASKQQPLYSLRGP